MNNKIAFQNIPKWSYEDNSEYKGFMSTYSGIQVKWENDLTEIFWSGDEKGKKKYPSVLAGHESEDDESVLLFSNLILFCINKNTFFNA